MAMGFSTQASGFKPWLRSPSSRSFWASSKMAHLFRRPVCALQSTKNHFLDVTLVNSSAGVRQSSCYSNLPFHKTIGFKDPRCFSVEQMEVPKLLSGNPLQWFKVAERMRKEKTEVCHNNNKKNHNHTSGVINDFEDKVNDFEDGGADVMEFHTSNLHNMGTEKLFGPGQTHNDQYTLEILSPRQQSNIQEQGLDPEDEGNINGWSGLVSGKQGNKTDIDPWKEDISSTRMTPEEGPPNGLSANRLNRRKETSPKKDEGIATGGPGPIHPRERLIGMYDKVLVVDNVSAAQEIVLMLTNQYRHLVHACDTEVAGIDVKQETPVDHGEIVCFSIYSGPEADFGNGKSCIWVDVLDGGGRNLLAIFAPFFEDPSIKKVWHNYSFDNHVIENYGLKVSGFHADTMHMARLWDSSRKTAGGYSLEALTSNPEVMTEKSDWIVGPEDNLISKVSMNTIFGNRKVKIDGSEGKVITIPHIQELQRVERIPWICYSALDSISTRKLYENLKRKLSDMKWEIEGIEKGSMFDFYENYWRPFGELLVKMEKEGVLVDTAYLAKIEKVAIAEQQIAADRFRNWASSYCSDAKYMNVGSDMQLRQLFFGAIQNSEDPSDNPHPENKEFTVPNCDNVIEEGKKIPRRFRKITLHKIGKEIKSEFFTKTGKPSMNGDALKALAGNVSEKYDFTDESLDFTEAHDTSAYGPAYDAFGGGNKGIEACHAIASLCEVCSIDSLISNFILPLQSSRVSGKNGRVHCSLNINTETGRLSARRPNLQNQPALEKDRYKIRQAFIAAPGNSLIVADYGQLELRILAHLANCKSMLDAFKAGGDFHSRTAMNMYPYIRDAVEKKDVLLEWYPQPGEAKPPVPLLKDAFASERRKAKMLNFSIAYGKTPHGLARDWKVSLKEARETVALWYSDRKEVLGWQEIRKKEACQDHHVYTLLGRARTFPPINKSNYSQKGHIERAAINTPVQGSAADVSMLAMLEIAKNARLKELGWKLVLQIHDEVILEGPTESAEVAKGIVVECMSKPFDGKNILRVDLSVDAKFAQNWYAAK